MNLTSSRIFGDVLVELITSSEILRKLKKYMISDDEFNVGTKTNAPSFIGMPYNLDQSIPPKIFEVSNETAESA
jgi:hypothetical protein